MAQTGVKKDGWSTAERIARRLAHSTPESEKANGSER